MLTSTFTGVRVAAAPKRATSRKIDTAVVARRTKASAPTAVSILRDVARFGAAATRTPVNVDVSMVSVGGC